MGKTKPILLLFIVLVVLAASVSAASKVKKACMLLKGSCIKKGEVCDGQQIQHKTFCKSSKKYKCCFPIDQKTCSTAAPTEAPTPTMRPSPTEVKNDKPIIGVLAQRISSGMKKVPELAQYTQYISASYVKYLESGGARVVPILNNQTDEYYEKMVSSINGVIFPGGSTPITSSSGMGRAGRKLYDLIIESGENGNPVPLWATCLGFQMLMYLAKGVRGKVLTDCNSYYVAYPLELKDYENSSFLGSLPESVMRPLTTMNITGNFHNYCVLPETFHKYNMSENYRILSTNHDDDGLEFISTVEHKTLPIYGTQWHVEKNAYEWKYSSIPHFPEAIHIGHYFAQLFGDKARQNTNSFSSAAERRSYLIYNHAPIFMEPFKESHGYSSPWQQIYFFN